MGRYCVKCFWQIYLISPGGSLPGGLLKAGNGLVEPVGLTLERLHLLPDGVHGEAGLPPVWAGDRDRLDPESKVRTRAGMRFHSNWGEFTQSNWDRNHQLSSMTLTKTENKLKSSATLYCCVVTVIVALLLYKSNTNQQIQWVLKKSNVQFTMLLIYQHHSFTGGPFDTIKKKQGDFWPTSMNLITLHWRRHQTECRLLSFELSTKSFFERGWHFANEVWRICPNMYNVYPKIIYIYIWGELWTKTEQRFKLRMYLRRSAQDLQLFCSDFQYLGWRKKA